MKNLLLLMMVAFSLSIVSCGSETTSTADADNAKKTLETKEMTTATKGYKVGDLVTDFSLKNVDGKMVSLADYKDAKGAIVIFTCNTCPYSVMYEDRINELQTAYAAKGYPVIAINPNDPEVKPGDDFAGMQKRAKEKDFKFAYLFDEGQKIYPQFGATRTPHVYVLEKGDKGMAVAYIGAIDDNSKDAKAVKAKHVSNAVDALMAGKKPTPNFTKAVGCGIKCKKKDDKKTI